MGLAGQWLKHYMIKVQRLHLHANELMESRVKPIAEEMNSKLVIECDVTNEDHLKQTFDHYKQQYGDCDFIIHAVAFANREDLMGNFSDVSKEGWDTAMGVSAYSLISISRYANL